MSDQVYPTASVVLLSSMPFINGDALIGAFMGATLYIISSKEQSKYKKIGYMLISLAMGYFLAEFVSMEFGIKSHIATGFIVSAFSITACLTVLDNIIHADFIELFRGRKK